MQPAIKVYDIACNLFTIDSNGYKTVDGHVIANSQRYGILGWKEARA